MVSTATFSAWSLGYRTTDGPAWQSDEAGRAGCSTQHFRSNSFLVILIILVILVTRNSRHASATLQIAILCLCGAFPAPSLRWSGTLTPLTPDGTSFNIQNPIPHPSQKEKVLLETRRAKECQRGIAGAAERAKEGGRVPFESSDTRLGARCREFESPHSDQNPSKSCDFGGFFLISTSKIFY